MVASSRLVVADPDGQILDHPSLRMAGRSGAAVVSVPPGDLLRIPEGSKLFTMPGSCPVAWNPRQKGFRSVPRVQVGGRRFSCNTVAAFLPPGYTRTLLPAAAYSTPQPPLPLWSYTAVGWDGEAFVAAAVVAAASSQGRPLRHPLVLAGRMLRWHALADFVRGKAGIYPELKSPPLYTARGVDMAKIFVESVKKQGLDTRESLETTPVIIQSFDRPTINCP